MQVRVQFSRVSCIFGMNLLSESAVEVCRSFLHFGTAEWKVSFLAYH